MVVTKFTPVRIDEKPRVKTATVASDTLVVVEGLSHSYADVAAVKGISFEVRRGEMFGLIGPDGAGKTTTLRVALGLLASLVWIPEDYMRFYFQYSHAFIKGGPFADEVDDVTSSTVDVSGKKYGVDFIGTRAQIDF